MRDKNRRNTYFWPPMRLLAEVTDIDINVLYRYVREMKEAGCHEV